MIIKGAKKILTLTIIMKHLNCFYSRKKKRHKQKNAIENTVKMSLILKQQLEII